MIKKIVVIGGESTGKSTLCEQLATHYHTVWVKEYAREYLEQLGREYVEQDLLQIAKGQLNAEDEAIKQANQFLFCDTDLQVIKVWSDYKYGRCDAWINGQISSRKYDGYIITSPDFPWQDDPLREHPEPGLRNYFFKLYSEMIAKNGAPYCIVEGDEEKRLQQAVTFIQTYFNSVNHK